MNTFMTALLAALIGGATCGVTFHLMRGDAGRHEASLSDTGELSARLARIEAALGDGSRREAALAVRPTAEQAASTQSHSLTLDGDTLTRLVEALDAKIQPTLADHVKASVGEALREHRIEAEPIEISKKRMTLAEAAVELKLSAAEEEAVRRITQETTEDFLKLLAGEEGSIEDARAEVLAAKDDPTKVLALTGKVLGNLGGLMTMVGNHQRKMREAVGVDRARQLDEEYTLTDLDPLGIEEIFEGFGN